VYLSTGRVADWDTVTSMNGTSRTLWPVTVTVVLVAVLSPVTVTPVNVVPPTSAAKDRALDWADANAIDRAWNQVPAWTARNSTVSTIGSAITISTDDEPRSPRISHRLDLDRRMIVAYRISLALLTT
jgi:hypothetical protein